MFDTYEEIFAARAASYQRAMDEFPHARDREFIAVVEPLGEVSGKAVCDMPAGGGYLRRYLPDDIRYVAVEPSPLFAASCPTGPDCRTIEAPIEHVPLEPASMDCIVSLAGLHHCPDLPAVFREMRRLMRPGGIAVIADVALGTPPDRFLNIYVDAHNPLGHRGTFLDGDSARLVRDAGFAPVEDRLVDIPWSFASRHEAGVYCSALFGIEGVPPDDVGRSMAEHLGTCAGAGAYNLRWQLRRIVCTAA